MIYVGIDDTDTLDDPGTNQLARHLVRELSGQLRGRMILRHQLLEDPRRCHQVGVLARPIRQYDDGQR